MNIVVVVFFVCLFISKTATYKCQKIRLISFHMSVALIFIHLFIFTTVSNTYTQFAFTHIISYQITGHCYSSRWIHSCTCTHLFRWFSIFNFHALVCPKAVYSSAVRVFRIHQLLMFELFLFSPRFGSPLAIIALVDGCVISRPEQIKIEKQFAFIVRNSFTHLCVFYWSCLWCFFIYSILLHIWPQITRSRLRFT